MHLWQNSDHADAHLCQSPGLFTSLETKCLLGFIAEVWTKWSTTPSQQGNTEMPPSSFSPTEQEVTRASSVPAVEATRDALEALGRTGQAADSDMELQVGKNLRSSYVFSRTPKKKGEKLEPDDRHPPEGVGMHFEDGFRVRHFFIIVLFFCVLGSLAFGIFWYRRYGMTGPQSGLVSFEVSSWMIGLISLVTTVWLKWAD